MLTPEGLERFERREQTAAAAAMRVFLAPRSVAVVGASRRRGTVGAELFHNLLAGGFNGPVYPVNPTAPVVQSVVAYSSIAEVPGPVDLAVVAVPAAAVQYPRPLRHMAQGLTQHPLPRLNELPVLWFSFRMPPVVLIELRQIHDTVALRGNWSTSGRFPLLWLSTSSLAEEADEPK